MFIIEYSKVLFIRNKNINIKHKYKTLSINNIYK